MNSRNRVRRALEHREQDRLPISIGGHCCDGFTITALKEFESYMGLQPSKPEVSSKMMGSVRTPENILLLLKSDFRTVQPKGPNEDRTILLEDGSYIDEFGCTLKPSKYYYDIVLRPLEGIIEEDTIKNNPWPDSNDPGRVNGLREEARQLYNNTEFAIVAEMICTGPFEQSCWMRGFEDFLSDLYMNPKLAEALMDKITEINIQLYNLYLAQVGQYIDVFCQGDDLAMQDRSFVPLDIYNKHIKKYHKRMYDFVKSKTEAKIMHHCCGSAYELIGGLIEAGVDILNPVQVSARNMEPEKLKREFGEDISFWGGLDVQKLLPFGTEQEIEDGVRKLVETLGKNGGYVFSAAHNIQPLVPSKNIDIMYKAAHKYGIYT